MNPTEKRIAELNRQAESVRHDPQARGSYYQEAAELEEAERECRFPSDGGEAYTPPYERPADEYWWEPWVPIGVVFGLLAALFFYGLWRNP